MFTDDEVTQEAGGGLLCRNVPGQGECQHEQRAANPRYAAPELYPCLLPGHPGKDGQPADYQGKRPLAEQADNQAEEEEIPPSAGWATPMHSSRMSSINSKNT